MVAYISGHLIVTWSRRASQPNRETTPIALRITLARKRRKWKLRAAGIPWYYGFALPWQSAVHTCGRARKWVNGPSAAATRASLYRTASASTREREGAGFFDVHPSGWRTVVARENSRAFSVFINSEDRAKIFPRENNTRPIKLCKSGYHFHISCADSLFRK